MSRPFFMPLLAPEAPGRRLGRPAGKSRSRAAGWLGSRTAARQARARARTQIPYLGVTTSLEGCRGSGLADAVLHRVLRSGAPVGTVVLDLGATATLEPEACAAILLVHQRLTAIGTRLRLAASARGLIDCLAGAGVVQQLGRDTIHASFRGAVLAVHAAQPGPGLAMGRIRTELEMLAETIELLDPDPLALVSGAPRPGRTGAIAAKHDCSRFTRCGWSPSAMYGGGLDQLQPTCKGKEAMSDLIAIGYPDETTAELAAEEARRLAKDLIIEPDAIASIVRDKEGKFHVHTSHHPVGAGASWGMFWGLLFGLLFFIPFFGLAIGAGMGALMGKVTKSGIDREFQDQVRGLLKPGTSALFLMVEKVTPDKATEALSQFGGTVLKSSLSKDGEADLQEALHGKNTPAS